MIRKHVTMKYLKKILAASVAWGPFFAFCSWLLVELKKKKLLKISVLLSSCPRSDPCSYSVVRESTFLVWVQA